MQNFDYMTPTRLIFGKEPIVKLPEVMRPLGKRVLLTYGGGSIKKHGLYDRCTPDRTGHQGYFGSKSVRCY